MKKIIIFLLALFLISCSSVPGDSAFMIKEAEGEDWEVTALNADRIVSANFDLNEFFTPQVLVEFDGKGKKLLSKITKENMDEKIGIFVDGELISSPYIRDEITGGSIIIVGAWTADEAEEMADYLNSLSISD